MKLNQDGINLIKEFEGFRANPYQCSAGVWTIGYGSTSYLDGTRVKKEDKPITELEAEELLWRYCLRLEKSLQKFCKEHFVQLNENQFNALVSFLYNVGENPLHSPTTFSMNLTRSLTNVPCSMLLYVKANGIKLQGLVNRRIAEVALFCKI